MSHFDNFDDIALVENNDPRCPVVLVLDCSDSMVERRPGEDRSPMDALNGGLDTLISQLHQDPLAKRRVDISVVTFGSLANAATPFATVDDLVLPILEPMGVTSMGAAVVEAVEAIEARKKMYKANGINYYRPWVLLISDGLPTDNTKEAVRRVQEAEARKALTFFAIGVEGADMNALGQFSSTRAPMKLSGTKFDELFVWLSASQSAVSASNPGEGGVKLPSPAGWAEIDV